MDGIKTKLKQEVESLLEKLSKTTDSKERTEIARQIEILTGKVIEIEREEQNIEERSERLKMEQNRYDDELLDHKDEMILKQQTLEDQKKSRLIDIILRILFWTGDIALTAALSKWIVGLEKDITITSCLRNSWLSRIIPKKK